MPMVPAKVSIYKAMTLTRAKDSLVVNQSLPFKMHAPGRFAYSEYLVIVRVTA